MEDEIKNIPPIPPTQLGGGCKNIDVKYYLTVSFFLILIKCVLVVYWQDCVTILGKLMPSLYKQGYVSVTLQLPAVSVLFSSLVCVSGCWTF